jgi:hypothetical protein
MREKIQCNRALLGKYSPIIDGYHRLWQYNANYVGQIFGMLYVSMKIINSTVSSGQHVK